MNTFARLLLLSLVGLAAYPAQDVVTAVEASVRKIDSAGKTITVKTADGAEKTFRVVKRTTVHGVDATRGVTKDFLQGLREGSDVVVHYTKSGSEDTAEEIDHVGEHGLKETQGTISKLDRGGKTMGVKGADGAEETYKLSDHAARDAGKDIARGSEKSAKVTVYYSEEGGRKVAHFFKTVV